MFYILLLPFLLVFSHVSALEYELALPEIDGYANYRYEPVSMNDKGQVIGYAYPLDGQSHIFIFDEKKGTQEIECNYGNPIAINNAQQVLGSGSNSGVCGKPFLWAKTFGFRWIEQNAQLVDFNDFGQVIGTYTKDGQQGSFLWDYGVTTDMGPNSEFAQQFTSQGYHVIGVHLKAINNKGELVGYFGYGEFNKKKGKYVLVGYKTFFWNGELTILPFDGAPALMDLNIHGQVLVQTGQGGCFLWKPDGEVEEIPEFWGIALNDKSSVLGHLTENWCPALYKEGSVSTIAELLGVDDIAKLSKRYSDNYEFEKITKIVALNNKDQILCVGEIWGDQYPCILSPKATVKNQPAELESFLSDYESKDVKKKSQF